MTESRKDAPITMAYQDSCDQMILLLIHGFPLDSGMWEPQIEGLLPLVRSIAPDLRGFGETDATPPPYTMRTFADDCADLLDHLDAASPVVVCGLSMGGYVAFEFYRRYRERVAALILTATRATPDSTEGRNGRDKAAALVQKRGLSPLADTMMPKIFAPDTHDKNPDLSTSVREMMLSASVEGAVGALMAMKTRPDSTLTLAEIDAPTLIIHGAQDNIVPPAEAEAMHAEIPGSKLVILPDAGHMPNLEQPEAFNAAVESFLLDLEL